MSGFDVERDVADALTDSDWLNQVYDALGPPRERRVQERFDIELEVRGGQTYCIKYKDGLLKGKKGFARGEPFLAVTVDAAGWELAKTVLAAARDGFPDAPAARRQQDKVKDMSEADLRTLYDALEKLSDAAVEVSVGDVVVTAARGPIESATRTVTVKLPAGTVEDLLGGAGRPKGAQVGGDGRLRTEAVAAFSPFVVRGG